MTNFFLFLLYVITSFLRAFVVAIAVDYAKGAVEPHLPHQEIFSSADEKKSPAEFSKHLQDTNLNAYCAPDIPAEK